MSQKVQTQSYRVTADGWIAGRRAKAGDVVDLTPAQAKYEPVEPVTAAQARSRKPSAPATS